jgi:uncharacterized protein YecE (DUF72 family)
MDSTDSTDNAACQRPLARVFIGCAGWSIPREHADEFAAGEGSGGAPPSTHLERYARRLPAVEINSSFYRAHRPETYARWADATPEHFRFSVKMPRQITHVQRLRSPGDGLAAFFGEAGALGEKLGPILVQLPPGLVFDERTAAAFFAGVREQFDGDVVCEPRHASWFLPDAGAVLEQFGISRVAADPPVPVPEAAHPGGSAARVIYYRLHGSPRIYYSAYSEEYLDALAQTLTAARAAGGDSPPAVWCIFDNTALGAATANALWLDRRLG